MNEIDPKGLEVSVLGEALLGKDRELYTSWVAGLQGAGLTVLHEFFPLPLVTGSAQEDDLDRLRAVEHVKRVDRTNFLDTRIYPVVSAIFGSPRES